MFLFRYVRMNPHSLLAALGSQGALGINPIWNRVGSRFHLARFCVSPIYSIYVLLLLHVPCMYEGCILVTCVHLLCLSLFMAQDCY